MALFVPQGNDFQWVFSNISATRPGTNGWGFLHTPSATADTFSTYATLVSAADVDYDVYGIYLCFNNGATTNTIRNTLVNIGVDNAGGTSFQTIIPDLIAGSAAPLNIGSGGIWYYFPLYIPAGSSIGIQAGSTTTASFSTAVWLYGKPRRPEAVRTGSYVTAFGATRGTSWRGTNITPGTTSEGTLTQIGSATTKSHWWWQAGFAYADASQTLSVLTLDMAAGSSTSLNKILIQDQLWFVTGAEQISCVPEFPGGYNNVGIGENIYVRMQNSGANDTGANVIVYGLGG
jgi:hypothetical protein